MNICFLTFGSWEGNASFVRVREFGCEMIERGHEISYVVDDAPFNRENLDVHPQARVAHVPVVGRWSQYAARRELIREINPDFVHVLNPYVKAVLTLAGVDRRIVADWDEWPGRRPPEALKPLAEWYFNRWLRKRASLVVVASRYLQNRFRERFGIESVYIPYATYLFPKQDFTSPFEKPTAVYMGNLVPEYDHDLIFEAARILKSRGLVPPILVMGGGGELERWRAFVRDHGLSNISVPGYTTGEELWRRLRHAHVLLFPIRENITNLARCPSKTYAYAQARRPVITNRVGEVPVVLGESAQYIDCTAEAFADAIERAMREPALPDVEYNLEQHNWSSRTEQLLDAIHSQS